MKSICFSTIALLILVSGCSNSSMQVSQENEEFAPVDSSRAYRQVADEQAALGAMDDAMLSARHFDGAALNSLGQAKLDLMTRYAAQPIVIYLDLSDDAMRSPRHDAVASYLQQSGVDPKMYRLENGMNWSTRAPASVSLSRMSKTESPAPKGASSGSGDQGSTSFSSSSGSGQSGLMTGSSPTNP